MAPPEAVSTSGLPLWAGRHLTEAMEPSQGSLGSWRCAGETLGLDDGHSGQAHLQGGCLPLLSPALPGPAHTSHRWSDEGREAASHGGCGDPSTSDMKVERSLSGHKQPVFCGDRNGRVLPSGPQLCSFSLWAEVKMTTGSMRCAQSALAHLLNTGVRVLSSHFPLAHGQASRVPCSAEATGIRGRHASPGTPDSSLPALLHVHLRSSTDPAGDT